MTVPVFGFVLLVMFPTSIIFPVECLNKYSVLGTIVIFFSKYHVFKYSVHVHAFFMDFSTCRIFRDGYRSGSDADSPGHKCVFQSHIW